MIALVLSINGEKFCTVGVGDSGVLSAHVCWTGQTGEPGDLSVFVGGLDSNTDEHIGWPSLPEIMVGDSINIQVIETDTVDTPISRKTPAQLREESRAFLTEMEAEHQANMRRKLDEELPTLGAPWDYGEQGKKGHDAEGGHG